MSTSRRRFLKSAVAVGATGIAEDVADKGYHSNETMVGFAAILDYLLEFTP